MLGADGRPQQNQTGDGVTATVFVGPLSGNATTASTLLVGRQINGVTFDGSGNITVPAAAGTLTGATLAAGVTASSLLSAAGGTFGTAAYRNTGTSGSGVALLDGANTWSTAQTIAITNSTTNAIVTGLTLSHNVIGTPAAGHGPGLVFAGESSTTNDTLMGSVSMAWADATHASRRGRGRLSAVNIGTEYTAVEWSATTGAVASLGFLGAAAVAQQTGDAGTALVTFGLMSGTPTFNINNLTGLSVVGTTNIDLSDATGDRVYGYDVSGLAGTMFTVADILAGMYPFQARLTAQSTVPITAADQTGVTTLYLTPCDGNRVAMWDNSKWVMTALTEIAITFGSALTSGRPYDVYVFTSSLTPSSTDTATDIITFSSATGWATGSMVTPLSTVGGLTAGTVYYYRAVSSTTGTLHTSLGGALANTGMVNLTASITSILRAVSLELTAWTNDTTRATSIGTQHGVLVRAGSASRRLAGVIYSTSTNTIEDSLRNRYLINLYNAVPRRLFHCPGYSDNNANTSYTDSTSTFKEANGSGNGNCGFITPVTGFHSSINVSAVVITSASGGANAGIGFDGITDIRAMGQTNSVSYLQTFGLFSGYAGTTPGKHAWYLCTYSQAGTATWFADGARSSGGGLTDYPDTYLEGWVMG